MASGRIDLQPSITLAAVTGQDLQSAGRIPGGAKSGMAVVTVTAIPSSATLQIQTSPALNVDLAGWAVAGSNSTIFSSVGVKTFTLTGMADYIRWNLSAVSGSVTMSIVIYAFEA